MEVIYIDRKLTRLDNILTFTDQNVKIDTEIKLSVGIKDEITFPWC